MEDNTMATRNGPYKRWRLDGKPTDPPAYTAEWHPPLHRFGVMVIVTAPDQFEAAKHVDEATGGVVTAVCGEDVNPVIVDRARFERLQHLAQRFVNRVQGDYEGAVTEDEIGNGVWALAELRELLQPGDLDPLPEH